MGFEAGKIAVRLTNWIGDVVMNVPALEILRENFPEAEITAIARPWVQGVLEFRPNLVDRWIVYDDRGSDRGAAGFFRFCRGLRSQEFDLGVAFTNHIKGALMLRLAGIPVRAGFANLETAPFLNRRLRRRSLHAVARHQSEDYLDLMAVAGLAVSRRPLPRLEPDPALAARVADRLNLAGAGPLLAVHAGAAYGTAKRWLPERYAVVCERIIRERGGRVALLGVAAEKDVNRAIAAAVDLPALHNLCGRTSLSESLALISAADAFLSNDSGLMHAAAAFAIPQVAIFGPTDVTATYPNNPRARTLYQKVPCSPCFRRHCPIGHDCMRAIAADAVLASLEDVLASAAHS